MKKRIPSLVLAALSTARTRRPEHGRSWKPTPLPAPNLNTASDWAHDEITSAVAKGFVPANIQNDYANVITRAEFCWMAVKFVEYATGKNIDVVMKDKGVARDLSFIQYTK